MFTNEVRWLPYKRFLLCAAEGSGSLATIGQAAVGLGIRGPILELPELEKPLQIDGSTIVFRHPLVRPAVYHGASPAARRGAHLALADALAGEDSDSA